MSAAPVQSHDIQRMGPVSSAMLTIFLRDGSTPHRRVSVQDFLVQHTCLISGIIPRRLLEV